MNHQLNGKKVSMQTIVLAPSLLEISKLVNEFRFWVLPNCSYGEYCI